MKTNPGPGKLVVLEGLDGAGTTTQAAKLADWLRRYKNQQVWVTREPSQGPAGAQIRSILSKRLSLDPRTLAALFATDRHDHLYSTGGVVEHLEKGEWVVMDRYYLSSFAYQSLSLTQTEDQNWLQDLHEHCIIPDLTLFLEVPAQTCMKRIGESRGFHFELFENQEFLNQVHQQYLWSIKQLRTNNNESIPILDGTESVLQVTKNIRECIELLFFNESGLSAESQKALWQEWPILDQTRRDIEEKLDLMLLSVEKILPSMYSAGGYRLKFSGRTKTYPIDAYFTEKRTSIRLLPVGKPDSMFEALKAICERRAIPKEVEKLPLFSAQEEKSDG